MKLLYSQLHYTASYDHAVYIQLHTFAAKTALMLTALTALMLTVLTALMTLTMMRISHLATLAIRISTTLAAVANMLTRGLERDLQTFSREMRAHLSLPPRSWTMSRPSVLADPTICQSCTVGNWRLRC